MREEQSPRVKEFAAELGLARTAVSRAFQQTTGRSLSDYFRQRQLTRAHVLLTCTSATTTKIAYKCGFATRATFYRVFRNAMGMTPAVYRERFSRR
jgi:AraC-like DNA-binding protein